MKKTLIYCAAGGALLILAACAGDGPPVDAGDDAAAAAAAQDQAQGERLCASQPQIARDSWPNETPAEILGVMESLGLTGTEAFAAITRIASGNPTAADAAFDSACGISES